MLAQGEKKDSLTCSWKGGSAAGSGDHRNSSLGVATFYSCPASQFLPVSGLSFSVLIAIPLTCFKQVFSIGEELSSSGLSEQGETSPPQALFDKFQERILVDPSLDASLWPRGLCTVIGDPSIASMMECEESSSLKGRKAVLAQQAPQMGSGGTRASAQVSLTLKLILQSLSNTTP